MDNAPNFTGHGLAGVAAPGVVALLTKQWRLVTAPAFQRLLRRTGLRSASSWPPVSTWPGWLGAFGLAIDHVLVWGLHATSCRPGPDVGSDHRPLIACLCVEEQA